MTKWFLNNKWIFVIIYSIFFLLFLNNSYLYDQDEAAYAGFARNMIESNDLLLLDFPFSEPHRKPPLHFWITALSFKIFGESEFTLRIFPAIWIFLTYALTYLLSSKIYNQRVAFFSFLILSCSLYFPLNGKIALVDGLLTFLQFSAIYLLYLHFFEDHPYAKYLFWFVLSLGALTKGPPIYILSMGTLFFAVFNKDLRKKVWSLHPWFFLPISVIPLFVWGYFLWERTNGALIRWMIDWYILRRATNPVFGQYGPPGTYLILFFVGLFPWSYFLVYTLKDLFNIFINIFIKRNTNNNLDYFIIATLISSWIVYEFMMSKLPSYVLVAYPILSMSIANILDKNFELYKKKIKIISILSIIMGIFVLVFLAEFNSIRKDTFELANQIKQNTKKPETIYFAKDYAVPSLAYYLDYPKQSIEILKSINTIKNLQNNSLLVIDKDSLTLLEKEKIEILSKKKLYLYDRNRSLELFVIRLKNNKR